MGRASFHGQRYKWPDPACVSGDPDPQREAEAAKNDQATCISCMHTVWMVQDSITVQKSPSAGAATCLEQVLLRPLCKAQRRSPGCAMESSCPRRYAALGGWGRSLLAFSALSLILPAVDDSDWAKTVTARHVLQPLKCCHSVLLWQWSEPRQGRVARGCPQCQCNGFISCCPQRVRHTHH